MSRYVHRYVFMCCERGAWQVSDAISTGHVLQLLSLSATNTSLSFFRSPHRQIQPNCQLSISQTSFHSLFIIHYFFFCAALQPDSQSIKSQIPKEPIKSFFQFIVVFFFLAQPCLSRFPKLATTPPLTYRLLVAPSL